jgi:hypothetical protein
MVNVVGKMRSPQTTCAWAAEHVIRIQKASAATNAAIEGDKGISGRKEECFARDYARGKAIAIGGGRAKRRWGNGARRRIGRERARRFHDGARGENGGRSMNIAARANAPTIAPARRSTTHAALAITARTRIGEAGA